MEKIIGVETFWEKKSPTVSFGGTKRGREMRKKKERNI